MTLSLRARLNKQLAGKKIALLGLGLDNQALLKLMDNFKIKADVTICDFRPRRALPRLPLANLKVAYQLENRFNRDLYKFDLLFRSPGWSLACPGIREAERIGKTDISSPLNLFFQLTPTKNLIGVTGSKGKGTTASLIYQMLKDSRRRAYLGGNIGLSPLSFLAKIRPTDYVVLELSSFQLEDLKYSPRLSVITNLFPEHLVPADPNNPNFHPSLAAYWQAKLRIARGAGNRYLVANKKLQKRLSAARLKSALVYFTASPLPTALTGDYNRENIGAAVAAAKLLKIKPAVYEKTVARFHNLPHRLEFVTEIKGTKYYDNSFSTTPESTIQDLKSFRAPLILIAGGADKGADFRPLAGALKKKVKFLVLLDGVATPRIAEALRKIDFPAARLAKAGDMEKAVALARAQSVPGDVVLLSTACASFGLFKNYKERGDQFQFYVRRGER